MIANMTHGGKIAMLGLPAEEFADRLVHGRHLDMITIKGIYGREMFETWYAMSVLLEGGLDLSPVITHRFAYRDFEHGLRRRAAQRPLRQGHPRLDRRTVDLGVRATDVRRTCATTCARPSTRSARPGCYKPERVIATPQSAPSRVAGGREV